jgi:hypothetical protein
MHRRHWRRGRPVGQLWRISIGGEGHVRLRLRLRQRKQWWQLWSFESRRRRGGHCSRGRRRRVATWQVVVDGQLRQIVELRHVRRGRLRRRRRRSGRRGRGIAEGIAVLHVRFALSFALAYALPAFPFLPVSSTRLGLLGVLYQGRHVRGPLHRLEC